VSVDGRPADAGPRLRTYHTLEEVEAVARAAGGRAVDVLVTHDRPAGIAEPWCSAWATSVPAQPRWPRSNWDPTVA
jgi:hypothetical protein